MEKTKITVPYITSLKVTSEDEWLDKYVEMVGDSVLKHPNYLALCGNTAPLMEWFKFRGLDYKKRISILTDLLLDIEKNGQKEPIKIYKDYRINTGHKRASCMYYLGYEKIDAVIVPDDYKL